MPYLIDHTPACGCPSHAPLRCGTPHDVAMTFWMWGLDVQTHIVYEGECPYRFHCGNVDLIELVLTECPARAMRGFLPTVIGGCGEDLVTIGDRQDGDTVYGWNSERLIAWREQEYAARFLDMARNSDE